METLYRKYRPQNFEEIIGQEHIKRLFCRAIEVDKLSHAYLFTGPRGTGKTTVARIVAKRVNCLQPILANPCNRCPQCHAIQQGIHLDVVEMDAASNRGIDDFRAIREKISYQPVQGKKKVYIIDEVHMLTNEAFNAILKMLEEPPAHALFILATTNPEKVPETVLSRCQLIPFRNLTVEAIQGYISKICLAEASQISDGAAKMIANYSKGGLRDALVLLEQCLRFHQPAVAIEENDVIKIIGGVTSSVLEECLRGLIQNDRSRIIEFMAQNAENGVLWDTFLKQLLDKLLTLIGESQSPQPYLNFGSGIADLMKGLQWIEDKKTYLTLRFLELSDRLKKSEVVVPKVDPSKLKRLPPAEPVARVSPGLPTELADEPVARVSAESAAKDTTQETLLQILKKEDISIYFALKLSKLSVKETILTITYDQKFPVPRWLLLRKKVWIEEQFRNIDLKIEWKLQETERVLADSNPPEVHGLSAGMKEYYLKLKKLFPDKEILIKDELQ